MDPRHGFRLADSISPGKESAEDFSPPISPSKLSSRCVPITAIVDARLRSTAFPRASQLTFNSDLSS